MIQTILYASLLFVFFTLLFLPIGQILLSTGKIRYESSLMLALGLGIGLLGFNYIVALLLWLGLPLPMFQIVLGAISVAALAFWFKRKLYLLFHDKNARLGLAVFYLYYLLALTSALIPDGNYLSIRPNTIQSFGIGKPLPPDNLLSYNFSRYIVEGIDPNTREIFPTWSATDRGPLTGVATALVFFLLGLKETAPWLHATPQLYFVYEALLVYLNLLSLLALWAIAISYFGTRGAGFVLLLTLSTAYFFQNIIFTWPKLLSASYVLLACLLGEKYRSWKVLGVLLGASILAHPIGGLYTLALLIGLAGKFALEKPQAQNKTVAQYLLNPLRRMFPSVVTLAITLLPWLIVQQFYVPPSKRLLYLSLFCTRALNLESLTMVSAFQEYWTAHGLRGALSIRLSNFLYPINLLYLLEQWANFLKHPMELIQTLAEMSFYQFLPALGLPTTVLFGVALFQSSLRKIFLPWLFFSLTSFFLATLIFGCAGHTVNHTWAYFPFLICCLVTGCYLSTFPRYGLVWTILATTINLTVSYRYLYFATVADLAQHAEWNYRLMQVLFVCLLFGLCLFIACQKYEETSIPQVAQ